MPTSFIIIFFFAVLLAAGFLVNAIIGIFQAARGRDEDVVRRRLTGADSLAGGHGRLEVIRSRNDSDWGRKLPFQSMLVGLVERAGTSITLGYAWLQIAAFSAFVFIVLFFLFPVAYLPLALVLAPVAGFFLVVFNLRLQAKKRCARFEEQLPDAIDLMVRSLRVGHPVSAAMAAIAKEMPAPIGSEFAIASEEVTYGHDVPTAFRAMAQRVPVQDLGFLNVVLQVQQDAGGNLVEALSGLSNVIRERYRMFRKVKALTVEGRVSAWILSFFPFALIGLLRLTKPDYFDQMIELEIFPILVIVAIFLLTVNVIAMRMITNIKV